jgi:hypothetical protein
MFLACGSICIMLPWLMPPGFFVYVVWMGMTMMGLMMIWIGPILLIMRMVGTRTHLFLPLPRANEVITIHERRGGQGQFRRGVVDALEHIKLKDMIFKDTGGGTRVAGHRLIKTMETVNHNIPDWMAQWLFQIRQKYMVDSPEKLKALHDRLNNLKKPIGELNSIESQLKQMPELKTIMTDDKYKEHKDALLKMDITDLQQMSELLYNGEVIHYEEYERFQEAASPYDMESYSKRREIHRMMQMMSYRDVTDANWMKWALIIFVLVIAAGIAYAFFGG